jgi:hypothetical protein
MAMWLWCLMQQVEGDTGRGRDVVLSLVREPLLPLRVHDTEVGM